MSVEYIGYETHPRGELHDYIKSGFLRLSEELEVNLQVKYGNGQLVPSTNFDGVTIVDWGSPISPGSAARYDNAFYAAYMTGYEERGHPTQQRLRRIQSGIRARVTTDNISYEPMDTYTPASGAAVGENAYYLGAVGHKMLWFKFHLCNWDSNLQYGTPQDNIGWLFKSYIQHAMDSAYWQEKERASFDKIRTSILDLAKSASSNRVSLIESQVSNEETQISSLEQQLTNRAATIRDLRRQLDAAKEYKQKDDTAFQTQLDMLQRNKRLSKLTFDPANGTIVMETEELFLYTPNSHERTKLGHMRISLDPLERQLNIINMTNPKGSRQHPHVPHHGRPCFGGFDQPIRDALTKLELAALFDIVVHFLETFNPSDSWGIWASYWFDSQQIEKKKGKKWIKQGEDSVVLETEQELVTALEEEVVA